MYFLLWVIDLYNNQCNLFFYIKSAWIRKKNIFTNPPTCRRVRRGFQFPFRESFSPVRFRFRLSGLRFQSFLPVRFRFRLSRLRFEPLSPPLRFRVVSYSGRSTPVVSPQTTPSGSIVARPDFPNLTRTLPKPHTTFPELPGIAKEPPGAAHDRPGAAQTPSTLTFSGIWRPTWGHVGTQQEKENCICVQNPDMHLTLRFLR